MKTTWWSNLDELTRNILYKIETKIQYYEGKSLNNSQSIKRIYCKYCDILK
jgi:hypothetical protein